jgi:hypothetical protein
MSKLSATSQYIADVIVTKNNAAFVVQFGSHADAVESFSFRIMGDPEKITTITSEDFSVTQE